METRHTGQTGQTGQTRHDAMLPAIPDTQAIPQLPFTTSILAGNVAPSSIAMYSRDFEAYLTYAQTPERARDASTLARWRTGLVTTTMMSPNTINRMLSAVKRIMDEAAIQKYISYEEAEAFKRIRGVKTAALKDRMRPSNRVRIPPEVMREIIDAIDITTPIGLRNRALLLTLGSSGLRVKELCRLKVEQIQPHPDGFYLRMYAQEGKNQDEDRDANISRDAVTAINAWLAARPITSEYIFTSFRGGSGQHGARALSKPISSQGAWMVVKEIAEPFVPGVKPHDFRRFVGTQLAKQDIRKAQKALGHKRIETTTKYDLSDLEVGVTDHLF